MHPAPHQPPRPHASCICKHQARQVQSHPGHTDRRPSQSHRSSPWQAGLSLIELLIALFITATLATLSWPRFETLLHKARRSEAHSALADVLHAQSRYRSTHRRYAGSLAELGLGVSPLQHYRLRLLELPKTAGSDGGTDSGTDSGTDAALEPFSNGFIALASPLRTSTQARDRACAELRITLRGRQVSHSASDEAGSPSTQCWPQ